MTRQQYLSHIQSKTWRKIKKKRMKLDGFKCCTCGINKNLTVHHLNYDHFGDEKMNDLMTLCQDCHFAVHHPNHQKNRGHTVCKH